MYLVPLLIEQSFNLTDFCFKIVFPHFDFEFNKKYFVIFILQKKNSFPVSLKTYF